jgi:hypothetical protein
MAETVGGVLWVGRTEAHEVVVNHPDLKPDEHGVGHIIFSPRQARCLAGLLIQHAAFCEVEALRADHSQLVKIAEAAKLFCVTTKGEMDELEGTQSAAAPAEFMLLHDAVAECFGPDYWLDADG